MVVVVVISGEVGGWEGTGKGVYSELGKESEFV